MTKKKKEPASDHLARMMQKQFADLDKRADERFKTIIDRFERVEANVSDIKTALGPMVQMMAMKDREMSEMETRLRRVERKVGISH